MDLCYLKHLAKCGVLSSNDDVGLCIGLNGAYYDSGACIHHEKLSCMLTQFMF